MKPHGARHPLDARLTGCLRQVNSKSRRFDLIPTRLDQILFCMVTDSHSESEEIQYISSMPSQLVWNLHNKGKQKNRGRSN